MARFTRELKSPAKDLLPTSRIFEFFTAAAHADARMLRIFIAVDRKSSPKSPPSRQDKSRRVGQVHATRKRIRKRGRIEAKIRFKSLKPFKREISIVCPSSIQESDFPARLRIVEQDRVHGSSRESPAKYSYAIHPALFGFAAV